MFSQKSTLWASTTWPFENFQPFRLMEIVLPPSEYTGAAASESCSSKVGLELEI
jgi:hypothetical protein